MLELRDLYAGYGRVEILHGVSLSLERGEVTAIVGVNGSGKTTLLKAAGALLPCTAGEVLLDGVALPTLGDAARARSIAYLSQGQRTPHMTVEQLVLHGRFAHLHYPRVYSARDRAIAAEAMERMGLTELRRTPLSSLSGGVRQKAYLAMALAQRADYLLLDEPTTYLDIPHRLGLMRDLRALAEEGRGVVTVLHDLSLAMDWADRIAVLQEGRLVACDTPDAILAEGVLTRVFGVTVGRYPTASGYAYYFGENRGGRV